ncbi:hypothetical protein T4D_16358 [Trichinella pseudospiralis]|uniref:Uncharacterized protein n=1 Tax=Trichinella pseudospiralis TaxID=6337 RepID=A0A0V1FR32_TRIPS|nr:hypothetical protein T4D_16358 [Trichinella pseudospiralis]
MFKFAFGLFYISILYVIVETFSDPFLNNLIHLKVTIGVNSTFTTTRPGGFSGCNFQIYRVGLKFCEIYDFRMSIKITSLYPVSCPVMIMMKYLSMTLSLRHALFFCVHARYVIKINSFTYLLSIRNIVQ